jgi:gas vesicle protein
MSMNLENLLQSLPSREDLASTLGLETRRSSVDMLPALSLFGTGMLFGAGLALLFAPKSGQQMRRDLSQSMQQYGYGEGEESGSRSSRYGSERQGQMASQTGGSYGSQQEYPRQMSGQSSMEQSRTASGTTGQSGSRQMSGHQSSSESELERTRTPGTTGTRHS